jgi:hypothetical protein
MQHNFPQRNFGNSMRRFCSSWYSEFGNWLEYSIEKNVAFCLCCYLFKPDIGKQSGGDTFVIEGFTNWNKKINSRYMLVEALIVLITLLGRNVKI